MTQSRSSKLLTLIAAALATAFMLSGCATPEEGSSMPWNRPDVTQDGSFFGLRTY